jgi:hypothetical protein
VLTAYVRNLDRPNCRVTPAKASRTLSRQDSRDSTMSCVLSRSANAPAAIFELDVLILEDAYGLFELMNATR